MIVDKDGRSSGRLMRGVLVRALAQDVKGEREALGGVNCVALRVLSERAVLLRLRKLALDLGRLGPELLHALAVVARGPLGSAAQGEQRMLELMGGNHAVFGSLFGSVGEGYG